MLCVCFAKTTTSKSWRLAGRGQPRVGKGRYARVVRRLHRGRALRIEQRFIGVLKTPSGAFLGIAERSGSLVVTTLRVSVANCLIAGEEWVLHDGGKVALLSA